MSFRINRACSLCKLAINSSHQPFSSTSISSAPKTPPRVKVSQYAKKAVVADGEDAGAGGSSGSLLSEVTSAAPDLSHLPLFNPENITESAIGEVKAYPSSTLAAFKSLTIPTLQQRELSYTKKPSTVVRKATLSVATLLDTGKKASSKDSRTVLVGPLGSGKSVLMMQATSYAHSSGWIVLYIPSSKPFVDSSTPYSYSPAQAIFQQPDLSKALLTKFAAANKSAFEAIKTTQSYTFGDKEVPLGTTLENLVSKRLDVKNSTAVMEVVFEELSKQSKYPILLAIDDSQSLFATSSYVDPSYTPVETYSLAVPRLLLDFISGSKSFTHGSILLAPSPLSAHTSTAMSNFLQKTPASDSSPYNAVGSSYEVYSEILSGLSKLEVPARLERKEAVGLVQMLQGWRGVRETMSDQSFMEKFVAADGNPREFSRRLVTNSEL